MTRFPKRRIPYHSDGTLAFVKRSINKGNDLVEFNEYSKSALNSEDSGVEFPLETVWSYNGTSTYPDYMVLLFPLPTNLTGIYSAFNLGYFDAVESVDGTPLGSTANPIGNRRAVVHTLPTRIEYSTDTTNGIDGVWQAAGSVPPSSWYFPPGGVPAGTQFVSSYSVYAFYWPLKPYQNVLTATPTKLDQYPDIEGTFRNSYVPEVGGVHPLSLTNVRGLRVIMEPLPALPSNRFREASSSAEWTSPRGVLHLYGQVEEDEPQRLQIQRADKDEAVPPSYLSWGNVPAGSSEDKRIRIKNLSQTHTAYGILVSLTDNLTTRLPAVEDSFLFSVDRGQSFRGIGTLEALGPGTSSGEIILRRVTASTSAPETRAGLIETNVERWG